MKFYISKWSELLLVRTLPATITGLYFLLLLLAHSSNWMSFMNSIKCNSGLSNDEIRHYKVVRLVFISEFLFALKIVIKTTFTTNSFEMQLLMFRSLAKDIEKMLGKYWVWFKGGTENNVLHLSENQQIRLQWSFFRPCFAILTNRKWNTIWIFRSIIWLQYWILHVAALMTYVLDCRKMQNSFSGNLLPKTTHMTRDEILSLQWKENGLWRNHCNDTHHSSGSPKLLNIQKIFVSFGNGFLHIVYVHANFWLNIQHQHMSTAFLCGNYPHHMHYFWPQLGVFSIFPCITPPSLSPFFFSPFLYR